jgi:integrase
MERKRRGRSEGSLYFRESDNQWVGSVSLGYGGDGKRKRRVVYAATKKEAQDKMRQLQNDAASGIIADAAKLTVGEFLTQWLEHKVRPEVHGATHERYESVVRLHLIPVLGHVRLGKLRTIHIEAAYSELEKRGASLWTRRRAGVVLAAALAHAVSHDLIPFSPTEKVAKTRVDDKEVLFLDENQSRIFLAASESHRLHALFVMAIGSGLRQGELLGLQWQDVDFEKKTVTVARSLTTVGSKFVLKSPKTKSSRRTIKLPDFVVSALQKHRLAMLAEGNIAAQLFCTHTGNFIGKSNLIRQAFRPVLAAANERVAKLAQERGVELKMLPEIRFHDLRHTHATTLLRRGHSIKAISKRLGHSSIKVTLEVYVHVLPEDDTVLPDGLEKMFG